VALVNAFYPGLGENMRAEHFRQLETSMYLVIGVKVCLTSNLGISVGLCNGSSSIVKGAVYEEGTTAPALPKFVIIDFGDEYRGSNFFGNDPTCKGWAPIHPITHSVWTPKQNGGWDEHSHCMIPLQCC